MSVTVASDIRALPLVALVFSETPAQVERRKGFNPEKLQELADSIKSEGLLQPIVVRPLPTHDYEVVAGERRVRASKIAGREEILASVRELTDQQVAKIQLIENLQREDVHPLAEAEGYEELLKKHGYSVEQIAAETGKSKAYIYARVKLLALDPSSRKFFQEGRLSASIALLIARIPVASLQRKASTEIADLKYDEPMSYREAADYIQREYMLRLAEAPFDTKAEDLVKGALPCGRCPKNTLAQPELFGDVKADRAGVCTDPGCFKAKREAWGRLLLAKARGNGQKVIVGADAKKIKPHTNSSYLAGGYAHLDEKCWDDPKHRTYKQILGKDFAPTLLQSPGTHEVIEIAPKSAALAKLKADGAIKPEKRVGKSTAKAATNEAALHDQLFLEIHKRAPKALPRLSLEKLIEHELDIVGQLPEFLTKAWGWEEGVHSIPLDKLTEPQLHQVLWELLVVDELPLGSQHSTDKLVSLAKSLKVDTAAVRKQVAAEQKEAAADGGPYKANNAAKVAKKKARK